jgi:hypothetical protein
MDAEFEERINRWITDPAEYSRIVYDYADQPNMIDEFFREGVDRMEAAFHEIQGTHKAFDKIGEQLRSTRKTLIETGMDTRKAKQMTKPLKRASVDPKDIVTKLEKHVGTGRADHFGHYLAQIVKPGYSYKRSDLMDIMQMCSVSECDLFRCDKAMENTFRGFAPFQGKLVGRFTELPDRIERLLETRAR